VTIVPIVRHEHRSNRVTAVADICVADHAATYSNAYVWRAS
jgi:hypothetical protein